MFLLCVSALSGTKEIMPEYLYVCADELLRRFLCVQKRIDVQTFVLKDNR